MSGRAYFLRQLNAQSTPAPGSKRAPAEASAPMSGACRRSGQCDPSREVATETLNDCFDRPPAILNAILSD